MVSATADLVHSIGSGTGADWRRVGSVYEQLSAILSQPGTTELPEYLCGYLAESLSRTFAHYDGCEAQFVPDFLRICTEVDQLKGSETERFLHLYQDKRYNPLPDYGTTVKRRRPRPFEATVETCRRLMDTNRVRDALVASGLECAGVLGGSASYGRFFNVVGALISEPSDVDLLVVVTHASDVRDLAPALAAVEGFSSQSIDSLARRSDLFVGQHAPQREHHIFSHKLKLWDDAAGDPVIGVHRVPARYTLSLHVMTRRTFDYILLKDRPVIESDSGGSFSRSLVDYRDTEPMRADTQHAFSGVTTELPLQKQAVELGWLSTMRVCHIEGDRYYPGLHQNLVLPQFELRWETAHQRLTLPLLGFRWKIVERLAEEKRLRPFELQTLSLSHARQEVFSPHVRQRTDRT